MPRKSETACRGLSGDYTCEATLVPIPNTIVKLAGPMIVPTSVKVGYRRKLFLLKPERRRSLRLFFVCAGGHVCQLGGGSPLSNLTEVKDE